MDCTLLNVYTVTTHIYEQQIYQVYVEEINFVLAKHESLKFSLRNHGGCRSADGGNAGPTTKI